MRLFVKKYIYIYIFYQVLSTPRLLDTSLLDIDTIGLQNVHAHGLAELFFDQKEKT